MDLCEPDAPTSVGRAKSLPPAAAEAELKEIKTTGGKGCHPGLPGPGGCHDQAVKEGRNKVPAWKAATSECVAVGAACCKGAGGHGVPAMATAGYCQKLSTIGQALTCVDGEEGPTCQEAGAAAQTWDDRHPGSKDQGKVAPPASASASTQEGETWEARHMKGSGKGGSPHTNASPGPSQTWEERHSGKGGSSQTWEERHSGQKESWAERDAERKAARAAP